jgi:hypothetical protein
VSTFCLDLTFLLEFTTTEYFNETHAQILGDVIAQLMGINRTRVIVTIISVTPLQKRDLTLQEQGQQGFNVHVEVTILQGSFFFDSIKTQKRSFCLLKKITIENQPRTVCVCVCVCV